MRTDEAGNPCPSTLGEYRDFCFAFEGRVGYATEFLDGKIAEQGRDEEVLADDSQMRALLQPLILRTAEERLKTLNSP